MEDSIYEWLKLCIKNGCNTQEPIYNPFIKDYWGDLDPYNSNVTRIVKKNWEIIPSLIAIKTDNNKIEYTVSEKWNPICFIDNSFLDFSDKVITSKIMCTRKKLSLSKFREVLKDVLNIRKDDIYQIKLPIKVIKRMNAALNKEDILLIYPDDQKTESRVLQVDKEMINLFFYRIGSIEDVQQKLNNYQEKKEKEEEEEEEEENTTTNDNSIYTGLIKYKKNHKRNRPTKDDNHCKKKTKITQ